MTTNRIKLISKSEAADRLDLSTRTIERYISAGHLEARRVGTRTVRIPEDAVDRLAKRIEPKRET